MKTLDELKAENAAAEQQQAEAPQVEAEPVDEVEAVETETEKMDHDAGQDTNEAEEVETEAWMKSDEEMDQPQFVPVAAHAKVRSKLKAKVSERDEEIEKLKAQIESMSKAGQQQVSKKPRLEDFYDQDNPEEAFSEAIFDWKMKNYSKSQSEQQQRAEQERKQIEFAAKLEKEVDNHYQRAAELSNKSGIKPEVFQAADLRLKESVDSMFPGKGELIVNNLIASLGEGSEKVMHHIGINNAAMNEFKSVLMDDPNGLKAMAFLGAKKAQLTQPLKRTSQAPAPSAQLNGNEKVAGTNENQLKRKYNSAAKSRDVQEMINIKRAAKQAGFNPKQW